MMDGLRFDDNYQMMTEAVEGGASLAWRLLATLEGGSLIIATSALLAYTARNRMFQRRKRNVRRVLISNTTNELGRKLQTRLESLGCTVSTITNQNTSGAGSGITSGTNSGVASRVHSGITDGAGSGMTEGADSGMTEGADSGMINAGEYKVDAIVIVGAQPSANGLDGMAALVTEDVHDNLRLLDRLSVRVRRGGCVAWACAGATGGAFRGAADAFDTALKASLQHAARSCHCEPIWVGRCETTEAAVERIVSELVTCTNPQLDSRFSIRNAAVKISGYVGRWLKIIN